MATMVRAIRGASKIISNSIRVKQGSPIGSSGDLRERNPRTVVIAQAIPSVNTSQLVIFQKWCDEVLSSRGISILLLLKGSMNPHTR